MTLSILQGSARRTRHDRRPSFPVAGEITPFGLYPFFVHPVLPGETLQHFDSRIRMFSETIKHPLVGAWAEQWLVYVKLTDIDPNLGNMFITDTMSTAGYTAAADAPQYFTKTGQIAWVQKAAETVHNAYFLDDGETPRTINGVRQVKTLDLNWMQNLTFKPTAAAVPADVGATQEAINAWEMLRLMNMTELSYEDYLAQYGVAPKKSEMGQPEILRYTRAWTLPKNNIDPATGSPSTQWLWSLDTKAEKPKKFLEPGFIIGLQTIRPKLYPSALVASITGEMWGFSDWYPSYNLDDPAAGIKEILDTAAVFDPATGGTGASLIYDHRDILSHGEPFVNKALASLKHSLPVNSGHSFALGATDQDVRGQYCSATDIANLFTSVTAADQVVTYEGIVQARIAGHVQDNT